MWSGRAVKEELCTTPESSVGSSSENGQSRERIPPAIRSSGSRPVVVKRKKSSDKEKQRNLEIKRALRVLSKSMPFVGKHKELSRIRTLRLAREYIDHLGRILNGEMVYCEYSRKRRPLLESDFEKVVNKEMQTNNSYKDRAEQEICEEKVGQEPRTSQDRSISTPYASSPPTVSSNPSAIPTFCYHPVLPMDSQPHYLTEPSAPFQRHYPTSVAPTHYVWSPTNFS